MKSFRFITTVLLSCLLLAWCARAQPATPQNITSGGNGPIRVLTISGDWKSQVWYQEVRANDGKKYRGRFIADEANKAAPGLFQFTDITNYTGQQYGDANYFKNFDVVLIGDIIGWSLPPRFLSGLRGFVKNGGGFGYMASYKWHTTLMDGTPIEEALPAKFGVSGFSDDWKNAEQRVGDKNFAPIAALPGHPLARGLDWSSLKLGEAGRIVPKVGSEIVLKSPGGAPIPGGRKLRQRTGCFIGFNMGQRPVFSRHGQLERHRKILRAATVVAGRKTHRAAPLLIKTPTR